MCTKVIEILNERIERLEKQAEEFATQENLGKYSKELREQIMGYRDSAKNQVNWNARMILYHETLSKKYDQAARRPWNKVSPDPAPPPKPADYSSPLLRIPARPTAS